jgi:hypothetical protein
MMGVFQSPFDCISKSICSQYRVEMGCSLLKTYVACINPLVNAFQTQDCDMHTNAHAGRIACASQRT